MDLFLFYLQEAEYLNSGDPKYSHLSDVLHVEVTCYAPPTEVYDKMSFAVNSLRKFLTPDPVIEFPIDGWYSITNFASWEFFFFFFLCQNLKLFRW